MPTDPSDAVPLVPLRIARRWRIDYGLLPVTADPRPEPIRTGSPTLTCVFGTTVAMWAVAYVCRLPIIEAPAWVVGPLLLITLTGGGVVYGGLTAGPRAPWRGGLVGLGAAFLNLLVLGALVAGDAPNEVKPSVLLWIPGNLLTSMLLTFCGALVGRRLPPRPRLPQNWTSGFAVVTAVATLLLLVAGGVVTGQRAGLAVTDWPNSFYYNMFLFPVGRMTGGIYYEHAHRLLGSLVGLCTLALAMHLWVRDPRRWLKWVGAGALALVIFQGILGGLRVTGTFTLSADPADVTPRILLAILHGITGQTFFASLAAIVAFTTSRWRNGPPALVAVSTRTDRQLAFVALGAYLIQLATGAIVRHLHKVLAGDLAYAPEDPQGLYQRFLILHLVLAALMTSVVVAVAVRGMTHYAAHPPLRRLCRWLIGLLIPQLLLGLAALIAASWSGFPLTVDALVTTLHQGNGAVLFALLAAYAAWTFRCLRPSPVAVDAR